MKLILYGLGKGLDLVEQKLKREHEILGYMDSYSKLKVFRGKPFFELEDINDLHFDFIIIVVRDKKTAWNIQEDLVINYKIDIDKIVPFYVYAKYESYDIKLQSIDLEKVQGLILGNSYAKHGILANELSIPFINLAVRGQDIYYDYRTFQKCITTYGKRMKKLKYVIIDLYDYHYFNIDLSMMKYTMDYYDWGGYLEEHNFKRNHNFTKTFYDELMEHYRISIKPSYIDRLFYDINVKSDDYDTEENVWKHIEKNPSVNLKLIIGDVILKRFESTVNENIQLLDLLLNEIKKFNQHVKVIFTLIPKYILIERATEPFMKLWKDEFEDIVKCLCNKYEALFLNYKDCLEISDNHMFYQDVVHMNTVGARAFTAILNEDIKKIEIIKEKSEQKYNLL